MRVKEILALLVVAFAPAACMFDHSTGERKYVCTVDSKLMCIKEGCKDVSQAVRDNPQIKRKYVLSCSSYVDDDTKNENKNKKQVRKKCLGRKMLRWLYT